MPHGKFVNHKGRSRDFTSPEELQQESEEESSSEEESGDDDQPGGWWLEKARGAILKSAAPAGKMPTSSKEKSDEDDRDAKKGVAGLIEIKNSNRRVKKATQKLSNLDLDAKPELTRREREQYGKHKSYLRYQKRHAEGKTHQAKADLARLALIRQQRADAAAKREAEIKKKTTDDKKAADKA